MREGKSAEIGLLVLRVVLGLVLLTHGWPKLIGGGATATADFFGQIGIPAPELAAWFVTLLEFFGGLALIAGLFVPILAALFALELTLGILLVHVDRGWYVVGPGARGTEFNVVMIAGLLALMLVGSGRPSLDQLIASRSRGAAASEGGSESPPTRPESPDATGG